MSFEPLYIESWIYTTLTGDDTLTDALAAINNDAPGYQQGVYLHLAPQFDRVSGVAPEVPYIVVTREDTGLDTMAIEASRAKVDLEYRVTFWDSQNGAVSMDRVLTIADRVDALLHGVSATVASTAGDISLFCRRVRTGVEIEEQQGGEVFYGAFGVYRFAVGEEA